MKKRIFALLCMLALLTACGPKNPDEPTNVPQTPPGTETPTQPDKPEPSKQPDIPEPPPEDPNAIQFFTCGTLDLSNPDSINGRENFEEFLNVTGTGKSASIELVKKDGSLTLSFDGETYTLKTAEAETTWKQLQIVESSASGKIYQTFRLTNEENQETPDGEQTVTLFQEIIES